MDATPAKTASPARLSAFQALTRCEMRSWKSFPSIWMPAMVSRARLTQQNAAAQDSGDGGEGGGRGRCSKSQKARPRTGCPRSEINSRARASRCHAFEWGTVGEADVSRLKAKCDCLRQQHKLFATVSCTPSLLHTSEIKPPDSPIRAEGSLAASESDNLLGNDEDGQIPRPRLSLCTAGRLSRQGRPNNNQYFLVKKTRPRAGRTSPTSKGTYLSACADSTASCRIGKLEGILVSTQKASCPSLAGAARLAARDVAQCSSAAPFPTACKMPLSGGGPHMQVDLSISSRTSSGPEPSRPGPRRTSAVFLINA